MNRYILINYARVAGKHAALTVSLAMLSLGRLQLEAAHQGAIHRGCVGSREHKIHGERRSVDDDSNNGRSGLIFNRQHENSHVRGHTQIVPASDAMGTAMPKSSDSHHHTK